ncbi:MAG: hypothetical protein Q9170_002801 [Blastenia crenularia]
MSGPGGRRGHLASESIDKNARNRTTSQSSRRQATLYDAVAGSSSCSPPPQRISSSGFIPTSHAQGTSHVPLPPEEVLFRRRNAPDRYEEDDIYWAHENLDPERQQLPDSDLLKAVHAYVSDFYGKVLLEERKGRVSFDSMDETALMAFGVLLEEEMERVLGDTGDLVFVEGAKGREVGSRRRVERKDRGRKSKVVAAKGPRTGESDEAEDEEAESEQAEGEEVEDEEGSGVTDDGDEDTSSVTESTDDEPVRKRRKIRPPSDESGRSD